MIKLARIVSRSFVPIINRSKIHSTGSVETVAGIPDAHASIFDSAAELFVSPPTHEALSTSVTAAAAAAVAGATASAPQYRRAASSMSSLSDSVPSTVHSQPQSSSLPQAASMPSLQSTR